MKPHPMALVGLGLLELRVGIKPDADLDAGVGGRAAPVIRVLLEAGDLALLVLDQVVWASPDRCLGELRRVQGRFGRDDRAEHHGQDIGQALVRFRERDLDRQRIDRLDPRGRLGSAAQVSGDRCSISKNCEHRPFDSFCGFAFADVFQH